MKFIAYRGRGKMIYEFSESVRFSERKCGSEGRLFVARDTEKIKSRDRQELWKYLVEQDEYGGVCDSSHQRPACTASPNHPADRTVHDPFEKACGTRGDIKSRTRCSE